MLKKKRGALALLNHGSLALSVCCGWRKKKRGFLVQIFLGGKEKTKTPQKGCGGWRARCSRYLPEKCRGEKREAVQGCWASTLTLRARARADSRERKGSEGRLSLACSNTLLQKLCCQTIRCTFLKSPNLKIQFEHSREHVFTLRKTEVWMASSQKM